MSATSETVDQGGMKLWLRAARAFAFPASVVPMLLGAATAWASGVTMLWYLLPPVLVAGILLHAAVNMQNDRSDYKKGVDREDTRGGSRVLVEGLMTPETMRRAFWICLLVALAIGLGLAALRGWELLVIGLLGLLGALTYSSGGSGYKYRALGDPMVGLLMGPGMVIGAHVALGGSVTAYPLLVSIPVACIVMGILAANNLRDRDHDIQAGIRTIAILLGARGAAAWYTLLLLGAPLSVAALVLAGVLPLPALAPLLTLPLILRNVRWALRGVRDPDQLVNLDVATAQLHMLFGLLLTGGLVAGVWLQ